mmetsp:Transcript_31975/g.72020  ORF Transcript_31975/g.72020 Transcript_31975/m.72020 type:complete len:237 (-) Transcript_31975:352-1062(-)
MGSPPGSRSAPATARPNAPFPCPPPRRRRSSRGTKAPAPPPPPEQEQEQLEEQPRRRSRTRPAKRTIPKAAPRPRRPRRGGRWWSRRFVWRGPAPRRQGKPLCGLPRFSYPDGSFALDSPGRRSAPRAPRAEPSERTPCPRADPLRGLRACCQRFRQCLPEGRGGRFELAGPRRPPPCWPSCRCSAAGRPDGSAPRPPGSPALRRRRARRKRARRAPKTRRRRRRGPPKGGPKPGA